MHILTIVFGPAATQRPLHYKTAAGADRALQEATAAIAGFPGGPGVPGENIVKFNDDFGQSAAIISSELHGMLIEDTEASTEAHIQRGLDQARLQAAFETRAKSDQTLRTSAITQHLMAHH